MYLLTTYKWKGKRYARSKTLKEIPYFLFLDSKFLGRDSNIDSIYYCFSSLLLV